MVVTFKKENAKKYNNENPSSLLHAEIEEKPIGFELKLNKEDNALIERLAKGLPEVTDKKSWLVNYIIECIVFDFFNHLDEVQQYVLSTEIDGLLIGKSNFSWVEEMGVGVGDIAYYILHSESQDDIEMMKNHQPFIDSVNSFIKKHQGK